MPNQTYVRPPLVYSETANASHYTIARDFDTADGAGRLFVRTTVQVELDSSNPSRADLVPPFPARIWFRATTGDVTLPRGELIFELHPIKGKVISDSLMASGLLAPTFLATSEVTLDTERWKTAFLPWLNELKEKHGLIRDDGTKQSLKTFSPEAIFDGFFLSGQVCIEAKGELFTEVVPIVAAASGNFVVTFLLGRLHAAHLGEAPLSVRQLLVWAQQTANTQKGLQEHSQVAPIPLGHFYSLVDKDLFPGAPYANHPFLMRLVNQDSGDFWNSIYNPLWMFVSPNVPRWRRMMLMTEYTSRDAPTFWPGWSGYDAIVNDGRQQATVAGETYWKLKDGLTTVAIEVNPGPARLAVREVFGGDFGNEAKVTLTKPDFGIVADLPAVYRTVNHITGALVSDNHQRPSDLVGTDHTHRHSILLTISEEPVFEICSGAAFHAVKWVNQSARFGIVEIGLVSVRAAVSFYWALLQSEQWKDSQVGVLEAVSPNEGNLDAVNTWDGAYLSIGILQWALYALERTGELAGFLMFLERSEPARFKEYFTRHGIGFCDVAISPGDNIPRGIVSVDGAPMNEAANKAVMRDYKWSAVFRQAQLDVLVQLAQLRYAYERLRILRDLQLRLADNNTYKVGDLITGQHLVALLFDQHTNRPANVAGDLRTAIGGLLPVGVGFDQSALDEITQNYAYVNARNMNDHNDRRNRIDAHRDITGSPLDKNVGSFDWPDGQPNQWVTNSPTCGG